MTYTDLPPTRAFGLGMRPPHYSAFLDGDVDVDFVEVISENFMVDGGRPLDVLARVRAHYPVALHGVSMSIGSADGLNPDYLRRLRMLADRIEPIWVSDHLSWTGIEGFNSHDLLPLPYTREALDLVCDNIDRAQEMLGRAMLLENPSSYVEFADAAYGEWDFIAEMSRRTGCYLLLDVNNVFVSAANHGFDAIQYLDAIPADRVRQVHLAGHSQGRDGLLIDTHDHPVPDGVWALYRAAVERLGDVATMIERDDDIPALEVLLGELDMARAIAAPHLRAAA
jgi:uncharacterized protein (UPF0276 family)